MQRTNISGAGIPNAGIADSGSRYPAVNWVWLTPLLLSIAWCLANISAVKWLFSLSIDIPALYKTIVGFSIVALIVRSSLNFSRKDDRNSHRPPAFSPNLVLRRYPLLLLLGAGICSIALQWIIDIGQLSVFFFILGTYGLCGLFAEPTFWRKNLPIAGLLACILPFSGQLNSGLGLPARVLTAKAVENLLSFWQIGAISSYDIIVLENGIAHIDVPCSGIKTLLVGTLFLLAATFLEKRQVGLKWLAVCTANFLMLVSANALRVLVLVVVADVWQQPNYAEILHVPLGIVGLVCACFLGWLMLQKVPRIQGSQKIELKAQQDAEIFTNQRWAKPGIVATVVVLAAISQLYPASSEPVAIAPLNFPAPIISESIPLNAGEQKFFGNYPDIQTEKKRFVSGNLRGSLLAVASTSWQTYHAPELCFAASGITVNRMETKQLTTAVTARWLSLQNSQLSATYWLQSSHQTTDNFLSRIGSDLTHKDRTWVLVSILFDSPVNSESQEVKDFTETIHATVKQSLTNS
ncbi:MAG: exosortase O [Oscillatoriaceae cyanobacterium Prado104]|jgi:exosortase O|nr:exosortase O [Oscillatoriaceae cyanobacterium Prado104]